MDLQYGACLNSKCDSFFDDSFPLGNKMFAFYRRRSDFSVSVTQKKYEYQRTETSKRKVTSRHYTVTVTRHLKESSATAHPSSSTRRRKDLGSV